MVSGRLPKTRPLRRQPSLYMGRLYLAAKRVGDDVNETGDTGAEKEMNNRIKLAEAMGFRQGRWFFQKCMFAPKPISEWQYIWWPDEFDPFTNVRHDYAVLEWMRNRKEDLSNPGWAGSFGKFAKLLKASCWYEIGDYARAALKVLG